MARKAKAKKTKEQKQKSGLTVKDFMFPGEKSSYTGGVIGTAIAFLWIGAMAFFFLKTPAGKPMWWVSLEALAWPVLAVIIANVIAVKPRAEQIKKAGRQAKVMSNNFTELYKILTRQASLLGFKKPPDMYVVNDTHPVIYSIPSGPGAVILSNSLKEALGESELESLIAHELTHIRCKHVRLELAIVFIRSANPAVKILLFPVLLVMFFARAWIDLIDFTADRGSLLVTLKPAVVNSALVRFAVLSDPNAGITPDELNEFLNSAGDIQTDAQQLERHFKVGQFMSSQPNLRERVEQLTQFPETEQGKVALAKMAELQGVTMASIPLVKTSQSMEVETVHENVEG